MAIIKELNSSYGVSASYHRILAVSINVVNKEVVIAVASYLTKKARNEGCDPLDIIDIEVPKEDYDSFLTEPIMIASYHWLKNNVVGFEESEDDL